MARTSAASVRTRFVAECRRSRRLRIYGISNYFAWVPSPATTAHSIVAMRLLLSFAAGLAVGRAAGLAVGSGGPLRLLARRFRSAMTGSSPTAPTPTAMAAIDTVIFDCDGVLYLNKAALPGAPEALAALRRVGKRLLFVTNAAAMSRAGLAAKLGRLGYSGIASDDCVTSASAAATYLSVARPDVKRAYVVGAVGLVDELALVGIDAVGPGTPARDDAGKGLEDMVAEGWSEAKDGAAIDAIVVGLVVEGLSYACLAKASAYARNPRRAFVATNEDASFPAGMDVVLPAGGTMATAVAYGAERQPDVWVGKPSKDLAQLVVRTHGLVPRRTLMVGDRCNTDVAFGNSVGMRTCLVLSGCHTRADAQAAPPGASPEFIADSVVDLGRVCG